MFHQSRVPGGAALALTFFLLVALTARAGLAQDSSLDARLEKLVSLGRELERQGAPDRAVSALREALALLRREAVGDDLERRSVPVLATLAFSLASLGETDEAIGLVEQALPAIESGLVDRKAMADLFLAAERAAVRIAASKDFDAGERLRNRFQAHLDPARDGRVLAQLQHQRGLAAMRAGLSERAAAAFEAAARLRRQQDDPIELAWSLAGQGSALRLAGDLERSCAALGAAGALSLQHGAPEIEQAVAAELMLLMQQCAADPGDDHDLPEMLRSISAALESAPTGLYLASMWMTVCEISLRAELDQARSETWLDCAQRLERLAFADHQHGWAAQGLLIQAAMRREAGGADLVELAAGLATRALEAAQTAADPILVARAQGELARCEWARGRTAVGDAQLEAMLATCEAARLKTLALSILEASQPAPLIQMDEVRSEAWRRWRGSASTLDDRRPLTSSTGGSAATKRTLLAFPRNAVLATVERTESGALVCRSEISREPVEVPLSTSTSWVRVPGIDLLARGAFVQIFGGNDGSGEISSESSPSWSPLARTYALSPGSKLLIRRDGGVQLVR